MKLIITFFAVIFSLQAFAQNEGEQNIVYTNEKLADVNVLPINITIAEGVERTNEAFRRDLLVSFVHGFNSYVKQAKDASDVKSISADEANTYRYYATLNISDMDDDSETDVEFIIFDRKYNMSLFHDDFSAKGHSRNIVEATLDAFYNIGFKAARKVLFNQKIKADVLTIVDSH
ncbi:MAG: hypothetical protein IKR17_04865 [Bacteroidales bacterium]|nr:hypothetical protein [Bacteroidales bacterium]